MLPLILDVARRSTMRTWSWTEAKHGRCREGNTSQGTVVLALLFRNSTHGFCAAQASTVPAHENNHKPRKLLPQSNDPNRTHLTSNDRSLRRLASVRVRVQSGRATFVPLPLAQAVTDIEHPRAVEDVRRRPHLRPVDDPPGGVALEVRAPHAAAAGLRVRGHHARAARLAAPARLVRLARYYVCIQALLVRRGVRPGEDAGREVDGVDKGTAWSDSGSRWSALSARSGTEEGRMMLLLRAVARGGREWGAHLTDVGSWCNDRMH